MQTQTNARPIDLSTEPLRLADNQPERWESFPGEGITFYEAASKILEADAKDGERQDLGISRIDDWAFGPAPDGTAALATIPAPGRERRLVPLRKHAFSQLCERAGAPSSYIAKLPAKLQMACVNHGMQNAKQNGNLLRLAGGEARAVLSDRYAPFDNHLVIDVLERTLKAAGMLDEARVRSIAYGPTASLRITLPGDDIVVENPTKVGDIVEVGLDLLNGEIGNRAVSITPVTWRLVCLNGLRSKTANETTRLNHIGDEKRLAEAFSDGVPAALAASRGMRQRMVRAVDMMVDDILGEFEGLAAFGLGKQDARDIARDVMAERSLALPEDTNEWGAVFEQVRDVTVYDVVNGVTHMAQQKGIDRRLELEEAADSYLRRRVGRAA